MSHEASHFNIADRQLLEKTRASVWTDIGEAEITHTIFGRAKVRITHKNDKLRRKLLLSAIGVTALSVLAWQGWGAFQQMEQQQQNAEAAASARAGLEVIEAPPQPEYTLHSASAPVVKSPPRISPPSAINVPALGQSSAPQQTRVLGSVPSLTSKPLLAPQPAPTIKPQSAPLAASGIVPKEQAELVRKTSLPKQPPAAAAMSAPAASSVVPAATLAREVAPSPPYSGDKQAAGAASVQSK